MEHDANAFLDAATRVSFLEDVIEEKRVKPEDIEELNKLAEILHEQVLNLKADACEVLKSEGFVVKPGDKITGFTRDRNLETITVVGRN